MLHRSNPMGLETLLIKIFSIYVCNVLCYAETSIVIFVHFDHISTAGNVFNRILLLVLLRNSSIITLLICLFKTFELCLNYFLCINIQTSILYLN